MRLYFLLLFTSLSTILLWSSCTKDVIEEIHIDTTINGNTPPDYSGVSDDKIVAYINKLFIDLLGRAPTQDEINNGLTYLDENNLSDQSRDSVIGVLQSTPEFYERFFSINSNEFLNGVSGSDIAYEIALIQFVYELDSISGYTQNLVYYQQALNSLYALQNVSNDFMNQTISLNQYFATFINNYFYDQVNMGSENFVKGSFDDLFRRAPTDDELANGVDMVNNLPAFLFLQAGGNKGDYINIVTTTDEFYGGIVIKTFNQLLLRDPTSSESGTYTSSLKISGDFLSFEKELMKTSEYAGF
ncbi:MAG: hypothetical protein LH473_10695 [Chitinophagales bacterium]|nr:hypothetical protein [Chitinophagales bacterium]